MPQQYEAIIVGGGHNGLVCGAYLARAGMKTLVLERRPIVGGACVTEEILPGFKVSTAAYVMALLQPKVILDLELAKYGFEVIKTPPLFMPFPDGRFIVFWDDVSRRCAEFAKFSAKDAAAYPEYLKHLQRLEPVLRRLIWETPPDFTAGGLKNLAASLSFLWRFRDLGGCFYDFYDILTLSAEDYLNRWFESDQVKAALAFYAGGGGGNGSPRTPTTAYALLRPFVRDHGTAAGSWGFVRGGMGTISDAIARSGQAHGLDIRTDAEVSAIVAKDGRASGVVLSSGEQIAAKTIISNANAKTTFLKLVDSAALPAEFRQQIKSFRTKASAFKVNLAVEELPHYPAFDPDTLGFPYPVQMRIGPSIDYLDQAFDAARYGGFARRPLLTVMAPSLIDDSLAPKGKHVLSIFGGHAAYELRDRTWDDARDDLYDTVIDTIRDYAPGFGNGILKHQVLTPLDLERIFDLPGGHLHHGEITVDQIFFRRPAPGYANYRAPLPGLYQCGASTHPGGGVTGVPGHNAAREILRDMRK